MHTHSLRVTRLPAGVFCSVRVRGYACLHLPQAETNTAGRVETFICVAFSGGRSRSQGALKSGRSDDTLAIPLMR